MDRAYKTSVMYLEKSYIMQYEECEIKIMKQVYKAVQIKDYRMVQLLSEFILLLYHYIHKLINT